MIRPPLPLQQVNWLLNRGGLGDLVGQLPPVRYALARFPHLTINLVIVPDFFVEFASHVLAPEVNGGRLRIITRIEAETEGGPYNEMNPAYETESRDHTMLRTHTVDHAYHLLMDLGDYPPSARNYLPIRPQEVDITRFSLPERYIVITPNATYKVKEMPSDTVNALVVHADFEKHKVVYLGNKETPYGKHAAKAIKSAPAQGILTTGNVIDLREQTTILEAAAIMSGAAAVCGVDNGLIHVAGCTNAPIIVGYTFVSPQIRLPIRNDIVGYNCLTVTPPETLSCRFCSDQMHYTYGHLFTNCYYKDLACVDHMTAKAFTSHLQTLLK
jgi:hypothetical protein